MDIDTKNAIVVTRHSKIYKTDKNSWLWLKKCLFLKRFGHFSDLPQLNWMNETRQGKTIEKYL